MFPTFAYIVENELYLKHNYLISVYKISIYNNYFRLPVTELGTGHKVQEGVGRKNRILKGTVLVAHPS